MGSSMRWHNKIKSLIAGNNPPPVYEDVVSHKDFMDLLRRERNRSDRNNHVFSVIVFHPDVKKDKAHHYANVLKTLKKRIRISDSIGWFDDESIGVFLPETPKEGAMKLCDEIHDLLQKEKMQYEIR